MTEGDRFVGRTGWSTMAALIVVVLVGYCSQNTKPASFGEKTSRKGRHTRLLLLLLLLLLIHMASAGRAVILLWALKNHVNHLHSQKKNI